MAKISALPLADPLDGSEDVPLVQNGGTVRINPADHLAYIAQGAEAARDQAADLVLPNNIFLDVDLATAHGAVSNGTVFKMVSSLTGLAEVRKRTAGGSDILYMEATTAALANAGDAIIGRTGGTTIKDALDNAAAAGTVSGLGGNAPNVAQFPGHNFLNGTAAASAVAAGTVDQPNIVGGKGYHEVFTGDGATDEFIVSPGFIVDDVPGRNILVVSYDRDQRITTLLSEGAGYTVSGKGTDTITITTAVPVAAANDLFVRVWAKEESGASVLLNYALRGYDNFLDGVGFMTIMDGAHHVSIGNPGGHNTFMGGAFNMMRAGCSYSFATGTSHDFNGVAFGYAAGGRGTLSGFGATHFGVSGKVGAYSAHFGQRGEALGQYSFHCGRRGKTQMAGEVVAGSGINADTAAGQMQFSDFPLRRTLTTDAWSLLTALGGSNSYILPVDGIAHVRGRILLKEIGGDGFRFIELRTSVSRGAGSVTTVVGQHSADADQITVLDESTAFLAGTWEVRLLPSASSGGFTIQARGENGKTIQAIGRFEVAVIDPLAGAL